MDGDSFVSQSRFVYQGFVYLGSIFAYEVVFALKCFLEIQLLSRVHTAFGKVWKVMEIENAISRTCIVLKRRGFSEWLWKSFGFLFRMFIHVTFVHFTIPPKNCKIYCRK